MTVLLEGDGLRRVHRQGQDEVVAVDHASVQIRAGEAVALMGPSGCGKSTLLQMLGLVMQPDRGQVRVAGTPVDRSETARARVRNEFFGFLHQDYAIIDSENVGHNVEIPLQYARPRPSRRRRRERVEAALTEVGLAGMSRRRPQSLSGGERQRVAVARATINHPSVILADEPTSALDQERAQEIMALLLTVRDRGGAVLMATHDPQVARLCDRVIRMRGGVLQD